MLPASRIQAAIEIVDAVLVAPRPADATVSAYFRDRRFIGSKDRGAINTRVYRIFRHWHRLHWHLGGEGSARAIVLADLILGGEFTPATLGGVFSGERFAPAPLTSDEKKTAAALAGKKLEDPAMPLQAASECPPWFFDELQRSLGDSFLAEMKATLEPAPMDLRVNAIKGTRDKILARLKGEELEVEAGRLSPFCIRVHGRPQISRHPLYLDGTVEVQDEGSQMVAVYAAPQPGMQVADFCAGAGGKTLALGALMENKGRIVAMDVLEKRLEKAKLRFRRAGLHNIETKPLEGARDKWIKRHKESFDIVLVDAPCSGTGTWRREPDKRWRKLGPDISELLPLQQEILDSACRLVRPGGHLVYATCSLLQAENEDQTANFLSTHADFAPDGDALKLATATDGADGFFAAKLRRSKP